MGGYYFNTDELQISSDINSSMGSSVYVDVRSGLTVVEDFGVNGATWGIAYGQLSLVSTNIPMTVSVRASLPLSGSTFLIFPVQVVVAGVSAVVVVGLGLFVYFKKRKRQAIT